MPYGHSVFPTLRSVSTRLSEALIAEGMKEMAPYSVVKPIAQGLGALGYYASPAFPADLALRGIGSIYGSIRSPQMGVVRTNVGGFPSSNSTMAVGAEPQFSTSSSRSSSSTGGASSGERRWYRAQRFKQYKRGYRPRGRKRPFSGALKRPYSYRGYRSRFPPKRRVFKFDPRK